MVSHGTRVAESKLPIGRCPPDREVVLLDESRREIADGEEVFVEGGGVRHTLRAIHTPGHAANHTCLRNRCAYCS